MAHYNDRDLTGVRIKDGYPNLVQNRSGVLVDGLGNSIDNISTAVSYSVSSSYAPVQPSYSSSVSTQFGAKQDTLIPGNNYNISSSWANTAVTASFALNGGGGSNIIDGGTPSSVYGGIVNLDGGTP